MSGDRNRKTIERAEDAGLVLVIDLPKWFEDQDDWAKAYAERPLDGVVSPSRCDVVKEARRLQDILDDRPAVAPDGLVYRHSTQEVQAALDIACAYVERHLAPETAKEKPAKKEKPHARRPEDFEDSDE